MWFRIGLIAAAFPLSTLPVEACSCEVANRAGCQVPIADVIVRATVVSIEVNQTRAPFAPPASSGTGQRAASARLTRPPGAIPQPPEPWKVTLSVSEPFRGAVAGTLVVRTGPGDCGYPFEVGHEYLVFANGNQGNVTVTTCSATQPSKMAVARIEQLRALRHGTTLPDMYGFVGTHPLRYDQAGWEQVQPMAGLTVMARSDSAEYRTQTADDGLYRFQGLPAARYQLSLRRLLGAGLSGEGTRNIPVRARALLVR